MKDERRPICEVVACLVINFISSYAFFIFIWDRTFLRNITIR